MHRERIARRDMFAAREKQPRAGTGAGWALVGRAASFKDSAPPQPGGLCIMVDCAALHGTTQDGRIWRSSKQSQWRSLRVAATDGDGDGSGSGTGKVCPQNWRQLQSRPSQSCSSCSSCGPAHGPIDIPWVMGLAMGVMAATEASGCRVATPRPSCRSRPARRAGHGCAGWTGWAKRGAASAVTGVTGVRHGGGGHGWQWHGMAWHGNDRGVAWHGMVRQTCGMAARGHRVCLTAHRHQSTDVGCRQ